MANKLESLQQALIGGTVKTGASQFIGTAMGLSTPNAVLIQFLDEVSDIIMQTLEDSFQAAGRTQLVKRNSTMVEAILSQPLTKTPVNFLRGYADYGNPIIGITLPDTVEIITEGFLRNSMPGSSYKSQQVLMLPSKLKELQADALEQLNFKTIVINANDILTIAGNAIADTPADIIIKTRKGITIEELGITGAKNVYLPEPNERMIITLESEAITGASSVTVPASYNNTNPQTVIDDYAFESTGNVWYKGSDERAPWGAWRLNGKSID